MTCIVGVVEKGTVFIGGDTAATGDDHGQWQLRSDEKVFRNGKFLIGFCGSPRDGQLVRFKATPPAYELGADHFEYMVTQFAEELRRVMHEHGSGWKEDNAEWMESEFLIAHEGLLYTIEENYQVLRPRHNYAAIGSGYSVALGSLFSTKGLPPEERITMALKASAAHNCTVRPPFTILSV